MARNDCGVSMTRVGNAKLGLSGQQWPKVAVSEGSEDSVGPNGLCQARVLGTVMAQVSGGRLGIWIWHELE